jgi:hypothetical protein
MNQEEMIEKLYTFKEDLFAMEVKAEVIINDIKGYAPKGINGDIEECSYLRVKQAQREMIHTIRVRFDNILKDLLEE